MLLEHADVKPDQADAEYGRTPLSWAAGNGHEGVVKMLLERADVNPDQADTKYGLTPLLWAAKYGREGVVKILLDSVPNRPGARRGPAGGLPRAPDGPGRLAVVRPVRPKGRTAVFE